MADFIVALLLRTYIDEELRQQLLCYRGCLTAAWRCCWAVLLTILLVGAGAALLEAGMNLVDQVILSQSGVVDLSQRISFQRFGELCRPQQQQQSTAATPRTR
jgi:hypothetical protein